MAAAVTASSQSAVDAGLRILARGGNAVDAAVAAALASCVADPCNTGLGGYGGYMVIAGPREPAACVCFGLWAPTPLTADGLRDAQTPDTGPAASAVPNVVAGLARAADAYGSLDWSTLVAPAVALANEGVRANATTRAAFLDVRGAPFLRDCFELEELADGDLLFRQPRLAATLDALAERGPSWFYEGPLGEAACDAWRRANLDVPLADWRGAPAAVDVVPAAEFAVGGHQVASAPLGLTGSACVFAFLEAARRIARERQPEDPLALALFASGMASVWRHRLRTPDGNDFAGVDIEAWIERALSERPEGGVPVAGPGHTAHLNVLDRDGTLVALTFTLGPAWFGGRWCLGESGVIMNAGTCNLTRTPPVPRAGRLFGVSNMSPTVMALQGGARIAVGSPGARRIPANVALVLSRLAWAGYDLQAAVGAGRLHADGSGAVSYEKDRLPAGSEAALQARFERVRVEDWRDQFGPLTAIRVGPGDAVAIGLDDRAPGFGAVAGPEAS